MAYKRVIKGTGDRRRQIAVERAGHPATFRKLRCPACSIGYAVESNTDKGKYTCTRCGAVFSNQTL